MMHNKIPTTFHKYGSDVAEKGMINVRLGTNGSKTVIKRLQTKAPLLVQKALYPDANLPDMAHIYLMSSAGGILQGDRMYIEIAAGKETTLHITTQAATKIYKMEKGFAAQRIDIDAEDGSYLEFIPNQLIPFKSSRFYQEVNIRLGKGSTAVYSETLAAGREASGEKFDFEVCFLRMTSYDNNGMILFSDAVNIEPGKDKKAIEYLFGGRTIWSTVYIMSHAVDFDKMDHEISVAIKNYPVLAGCSALPNDAGLFVRMLSDSIDDVKDLTDAIVDIVRRKTLPAVARNYL